MHSQTLHTQSVLRFVNCTKTQLEGRLPIQHTHHPPHIQGVVFSVNGKVNDPQNVFAKQIYEYTRTHVDGINTANTRLFMMGLCVVRIGRQSAIRRAAGSPVIKNAR